jgi:hypothetical protein
VSFGHFYSRVVIQALLYTAGGEENQAGASQEEQSVGHINCYNTVQMDIFINTTVVIVRSTVQSRALIYKGFIVFTFIYVLCEYDFHLVEYR